MADFDVLIVGGGPVGAALALALRGSGLAVGRIEARVAHAAADARPIALSYGSRLLLERLGVWEKLADATPIQRIHVSQRGGFGRVGLDAREARLPALGYVVDYGALTEAFGRALEAGDGAPLIQATVSALESGTDAALVRFAASSVAPDASARLLAVADGGALPVARMRVHDYGQAAVTARVSCAEPHRNVAYERFTPEGPLALLPAGEAVALVWTTRPAHARELCALSETGFLEHLQASFGNRLGSFTKASGRAWYPLVLKVAAHIAEPRTVVVGNAAQTLHPVAGQGLNLGLRDAWELAALLRECDRADVGGAALIRAYTARRRLDRSGGILFTDMLVRLFSNELAPLGWARGLGLAVLGAFPPARDFIVRRMIFGARG
ncbi:MAG TPA: FAD-dependent monooxygenase [Burkholderiales bacterium]|nr:FAD-dependent monooxygenase [Burkholderiales bacterium]